jgi:hypothetical protein
MDARAEVPMSIVVERLTEIQLPPTLKKLRAHAAMVRTLADELERATPVSERATEVVDLRPALAEQLAEELARLGYRMLECATVISLLAADLARAQA